MEKDEQGQLYYQDPPALIFYRYTKTWPDSHGLPGFATYGEMKCLEKIQRRFNDECLKIKSFRCDLFVSRMVL
jgi:hypothetical protein